MKKKIIKKKKLKRKGFTLIELLAVIVIMGILMMIAIPSISRIIENARKDTFVDTAKLYANAARTLWTTDGLTCEGTVSSAVDDGDYYILINTKDQARDLLPVLLDQGGKSSWGNRDVNGYVRVNVSTTPGIDNNGDGIYEVEPKRTTKFYVALSDGTHGLIDDGSIVSDKLVKGNVNMSLSAEEKKKIELTVDDGRLDCAKNASGIYSCTAVWPVNNITGICVDDQSSVSVTGRVEVDNRFLVNRIKSNNPLILAEPTLTTSSNNTSDASGLYSSTNTNSGQPTYYFRGNVTNNYVLFAGLTWRIIRINEDGTIRLISQNKINSSNSKINSLKNNYKYTYYSNGDSAKSTLENWYSSNISQYDSYTASEIYCEQAKVRFNTNWTGGSASMSIYTTYSPNFKCSKDGNRKGVLNLKIGLVTYDEAVYAGGYYYQTNTSYYLYNNDNFWTMSPAGFLRTVAADWGVSDSGGIMLPNVDTNYGLRPVINLNSDVKATGTGTSTDPYVIITN